LAWTETTRRYYARGEARYASDCRDAEWAIVEPFMPPPARAARPRKTNLREVWNAIQYIAATGCRWAMLPKDFPPFTTVRHYLYRLRGSGALDLLNEALVCAARARLQLCICFSFGREQLASQERRALISLNAIEQRIDVRHSLGGGKADSAAWLRMAFDSCVRLRVSRSRKPTIIRGRLPRRRRYCSRHASHTA
jgi:transposase